MKIWRLEEEPDHRAGLVKTVKVFRYFLWWKLWMVEDYVYHLKLVSTGWSMPVNDKSDDNFGQRMTYRWAKMRAYVDQNLRVTFKEIT